MGDHWKSLAQKLGAPGIDDPTTSPTDSATNETAAFAHEPEHSREPESAPVEPLAEVMTPAPEPEVVDEKPRKRSSWEALASMFNIQIDRTPAEPPAPAPAPVTPPAPPAAVPRARESRPAAQREKPRFNEPRKEREPARGREPETRLQVFQEAPETVANPALESMFADVPRGDLDSWKKPPRVVDDIGWGSDEPTSVPDDKVQDFGGAAFLSETEVAPEITGESVDRPRRRRRRRGGSRRTENAESASPRLDTDLDDVESIGPGDDYSEPESFEVDLSDAGEPTNQADPERRSSRRRRRGRKRPVDDAPTTQLDDGELNAELASERPGDRPERMPDRGPRPERTSGRHDRNTERSQSRTRGNEPTSGGADRNAPRGSERGPERTSERSAERGTERGAERGAERGSERSERAPRAERGPDSRREKRTERGEPRADRPPRVREERPMPPRSDVDELEDSDDIEDVDSEEGTGDKHRNIPSWADSLQAIIEGNMENHKRNDNRGGPPRGRPRSRR
jgi:hypothetical protein